MKKLDVIDHIAIQVSDISKSIEWYLKLFKAKILYQDQSWALLQFQNIKLALVLPKEHPPHVALCSEQPEKFGQLQKHRDGTASVYIEDLDKNVLEIL